MYPPQTSFIPVTVALVRFFERGDIWGNYPYWYLGSTPYRYLTGPVVPAILAGLNKIFSGASFFDLSYLLLIASHPLLAVGWGMLAGSLSNRRKVGILVGAISFILPWHWVSSLGLGEVSAVLASALTPWVLLAYARVQSSRQRPASQAKRGERGSPKAAKFKFQSYPQLAYASAFNHLGGNNFRIRPRHLRWVGNLALAVIIATTVLLSIFAPLVPAANSYASQPSLRTVEQLREGTKETEGMQETKVDPENPKNKEEIVKNATTQEITTPRAIQKTTKGGKNLEFIFHQEPRVRIKLENQEIEFETKTVFGQRVNLVSAKIYQDKEVVYEEIIPNVDLKYTLTNDLLVEEFVIKSREAIISNFQFPISNQFNNLTIEQLVRTVDVKVVSPDPSTFGFYSDDGQELFRLSQPFAKDAKGEVSNDLKFTLEKPFDFAQGYKLTKTLGDAAKNWLNDSGRAYPVTIDPSVIVSTGIVDSEVQFGGLQRKLAYASSNWYAFYNDATDVFYKKSSDGSSWGSAVDIDTADADNYNPSVWVEGTTIYVAWIDDSADAIEVNTINTASADALGTKCTSADQGTIDTTSFTVSISVADDGTVYLAYSDTSTDTEAKVFKLTFSGCSFTDITSGAVGMTLLTSGSALSASSAVTASFTHSANALVLVHVYNHRSTSDGNSNAPTVSGHGLTWDQVNRDADGFIGWSLATTVRRSMGAGATGTITIDFAAQTQVRIGWIVMEFTGVDTVGTNGSGAVVQSAKFATSSNGTTMTITLAAFGSANNRPYAAWGVGVSSDPGGLVPETGYTEIAEVGPIDTGGRLMSQWHSTTAELTPSVTWTNSVRRTGVAIEIKAAASGLTAGDRPVLVTIGNNPHMIFQDGDLSHSVYNGSSWTTSNTTIASVGDNIYSVVADGTNVWVLTVSGTTATNFYKYNGSSWSSETAPYSSETAVETVSLTYDSTNSDLYAHIIKDTSDQAYFKSTDATTISWSGETSYAFTAGDLAEISSPAVGAGTSQIGVVLRQGTNFEFAVVPENLWLLIVVLPLLLRTVRKFKRRRHVWQQST